MLGPNYSKQFVTPNKKSRNQSVQNPTDWNMWKTFVLPLPPALNMATISFDTLYWPFALGAIRRRSLWSIAPSLRCKVPGVGRGLDTSSRLGTSLNGGVVGLAAGVAFGVGKGVPTCWVSSIPSWLSGNICGGGTCEERTDKAGDLLSKTVSTGDGCAATRCGVPSPS